MNQFLSLIYLTAALFFSSSVFAKPSSSPDLLLAKVYDDSVNIEQYLVSEKLDGVRAYWDGKHLLSRQGNIFHAPEWFTKDLPSQPLDGELWIARDKFQQVVSVVRKNNPIDSEWQRVSYMLFELPESKGTFRERVTRMEALISTLDIPHVKVIKQFRLNNHKELMQRLDKVVAQGGEGLMLHRANAPYHSGRSEDLLKVKKYQDAEARVLQYLEGKGKFTGLMGALVVEDEAGLRFKIGSGFTLEERKNPPAIGSVITYKYFGRTQKGVPRFASFMRIRK